MTTQEDIYRQEVVDRLDRVAFYLEQREINRSQLESFCGIDSVPTCQKWQSLRNILDRLKSDEEAELAELVHLTDNVERYLGAMNQSRKQLAVVKEFKPYKVAANFVNTMKHGTSGAGQLSTRSDYSTLIMQQKSEVSQPSDTIIDAHNLINFDGVLYQAAELLEVLIRIWWMFLKYHTNLELGFFDKRIGEVLGQRQNLSVYKGSIPAGVLDDAKRKADLRKSI
ncbi:MAG: hypothetical protein NT169_16130 [Chloroflexi bacterium]|nr:hypothetical protein [Chloroflexota bacterium]